MTYEVVHFREAENILRDKNMEQELKVVLDCIDQDLHDRIYRLTILKQTLDYLGWRDNGDIPILEGRRYAYKGMRNRVAIEASLTNYEAILDALFRLQIGYDKGEIDLGIVLLTAQRSSRSPLGDNRELVKKEVESLYPTISLPVVIALMDMGTPQCISAENGGFEEKEKARTEGHLDAENGESQEKEVSSDDE